MHAPIYSVMKSQRDSSFNRVITVAKT